MKMPPIVSPQEWKAAREQLLVKEKELTRARDALAAERRRMPRMLVKKDYRFEGPNGPASLLDLFEGRPPADRLPPLLRARHHDVRERRRLIPGPGLRGLLLRRRPGRPPRAPEPAAESHAARKRPLRDEIVMLPPTNPPGPDTTRFGGVARHSPRRRLPPRHRRSPDRGPAPVRRIRGEAHGRLRVRHRRDVRPNTLAFPERPDRGNR
jgi:Bacterial protein of unknown function (DUF899)